MELTINPIRRLFKRVGAKRVSDKAAVELAKIVEDKSKLLAIESQKLSEHAGRRTVMRRDVKLARKILEE